MALSIASAIRIYINGYSGLTVTAWKGIIVCLISSIFAGAFYFLTIYFVSNLNLDIESAGFIISFYGLGAILGGYLGGKLSDKFSPLPVSIVNLLIRAVIFYSLTKITDVALLSCVLFILGVASYGFITSIQLYILGECQHDEESRLKAINIVSLTSNLGMGVSATLIAIFAKHGFHFIFLFCSSILFILSVYLLNLYKNIEKPILGLLTKNQIDHTKEDHWKNKKLIWLILICLLFAGSIVAQNTTTYSIYIQRKFSDLGIQAFSTLFTINTILVVTLQVPVVSYFSKYNKLLMVGVGAFLLGLGMYLICLTNIYELIIIACIIYTIGEMVFFSMTSLICYQHAPEKGKGHQLGLYRMTFASSRIVGPIVSVR